MRRSGAYVALICFILQDTPALAGAGPAISKRYNSRAALIETMGTRFDDIVVPGGGSGFLVGDRYIVTNSHVVARADDFRTLVVQVRIESRTSAPLAAKLVARDVEADLALLELETPVSSPKPACPLKAAVEDGDFEAGEEIFVIGYPLTFGPLIAHGILSGEDTPTGRWIIDAAINPGNSGGPAFDETGSLVGFAVSGIRSWTPTGGTPIGTYGINFIVPAKRLFSGQLGAYMTKAPSCWSMAQSNDFGFKVIKTNPIASSAAISRDVFTQLLSTLGLKPKPEQLPDAYQEERPYQARLSPSDAEAGQSKLETVPLHPDAGYRLTSCDIAVYAQQNAEAGSCAISPDGAAASYQIRLTNGVPGTSAPASWSGSAFVRQVRVDVTPNTTR